MARLRLVVLRLDRLWWWLALLSIITLLGHEIARSSGYGVAAAAELEGFGDEGEVDEEENESIQPVVTPPVTPIISGFQTDRGPPDEPTDEEPGLFDEDEDPSTMKKPENTWNEEEFEGIPPDDVIPEKKVEPSKKLPKSRPKIRRPTDPKKPLGPLDFVVEAITGVFIILYAINYWFGRKGNEKLALAWAEQFASENSVFEKNFSLLGTGEGIDEPLLMKEGQNVFKFYASGRRYCEGLLATLELRNRHDLISIILHKIIPKKDTLLIEVYMNDENMEPFVLAVTRRKNAKALQRENKDLKELANLIDFSSRRKWPVDELAVISDSREAAFEILSDVMVEQLFGDKVFEKYLGDLFISLQFSDQYAQGIHKKVLAFKLNLPPADRMADLTRLIASIPVFIDAVGRFKLSAPARAKADAIRVKWVEEEAKEQQEQRLEAVMRKKEERRRLEEARRAEIEARLSPAELARRQEKERLRAIKRSAPKMKMTRVG